MNYPDWMPQSKRMKIEEAYQRRKAAIEKRLKEQGREADLKSVLDTMKNPSGKHRLSNDDDEDF